MENIDNTQTELTENLEVSDNLEPTETDTTFIEEVDVEQLKADLAERDAKLADLEEKARQAEELSFKMLLQQEGLENFTKVFNTTDKHEQLNAIKDAVNQILMDKTYVPTEKTKEDVYTSAIEKKDVQSAIKSKFSKIFG